MNPSLDPKVLEDLRRLDTCAVANAIESFRRRLRNEGFTDGSVRTLFPRLAPMVGYAATITIRGSAPPTTGPLYPDRTDWWDYVLSVPAPRVLVVQDVATRHGLGALLGAVHVNILRALGCVAALTDGSVRDVPAIEPLGFPLFAAGIAVSHAYVHIVGTGQEVTIAGLRIRSGDLLHGDVHGVVSVPIADAPRIPSVARQLAARERKLIALCRSPAFTLEKLRYAVKDSRS
jgi:regulator of RNase E activity RraA